MNTGERIAYELDRLEMTQQQLADITNINKSVINRIVLGSRPARDDELLLIANALNISVDYLIGNRKVYKSSTDKPDLKDLLRNQAMTYNGEEISEHDLAVLEGVVKAFLEKKGVDTK